MKKLSFLVLAFLAVAALSGCDMGGSKPANVNINFGDIDGDADSDTATDGTNFVFVMVDKDGDGYAAGATAEEACGVLNSTLKPKCLAFMKGLEIGVNKMGLGDCNDSDPNVHPGAQEVYDGKDDDCDGQLANEECSAFKSCNNTQVCDTESWMCITGCIADTDCTDGNVCNGAETCDLTTHECVTGTALSCDDNEPLTTDSCDPVHGCRNTCVQDTELKPCGSADHPGSSRRECANGIWSQWAECQLCDDNNICTVDTAEYNPSPAVYMECHYTPIPNCCNTDTDCTDGNVCNGAETCDLTTHECVTGTALSCDDNSLCTTDSCDATAGCLHVAINCDDNDNYTADTCVPATGCVHTKLACIADTDCADGNVCNGSETCDLTTYTCKIGVPLNCDDNDNYTADTCVPATGCVHTKLACIADTDCADGNVCNGSETCDLTTYTCKIGVPLNCDDNSICTTDSCDVTAGCLHVAINCDDSDPLTNDTCVPATGCMHTCTPEETAYTDCVLNGVNGIKLRKCGVDATWSDWTTCLVCDDGNPCTADTASFITMQCEHTQMANCCRPNNDADCSPWVPANYTATEGGFWHLGLYSYGCVTPNNATTGTCFTCEDSDNDGVCASHEANCGDGKDGDNDGLTDCSDPDCASSSVCLTGCTTNAQCALGKVCDTVSHECKNWHLYAEVTDPNINNASCPVKFYGSTGRTFCWDHNQNGICDLGNFGIMTEDTNGDGKCEDIPADCPMGKSDYIGTAEAVYGLNSSPLLGGHGSLAFEGCAPSGKCYQDGQYIGPIRPLSTSTPSNVINGCQTI